MIIVAPVKQVLSGDTFVVVGQKNAVLRVSLTGVRSPRFPQQPRTATSTAAPGATAGSASTPNTDDVFGIEAREHLRKLIVGKRVAFKIDHKHPTNTEQVWATVWAGQQEGPIEESLNVQLAKEGMGKFKETDFKNLKEGSPISALEAPLQAACAEAEQAGRGVYQNPSVAWRMTWEIPGDFESFGEALKKQKTTRAVIEYVRDGSTLRMFLLDSRIMMWFSLAGVMSVRKPQEKDASGAVIPNQEDPLAAEAKRFTEVRLLQREVVLEIGGYDLTNKTVYGNVRHPAGNISEELVKAGLGKVVDWSISMLPNKEDAPKLRSLQKEAQENKRGVWKDHVSKSSVTGDVKEFDGVIAEVISGDTIVIRVGTNPEQLRESPWTCEERRISLASIAAPRLGPRLPSTGDSGGADEKYAVEAREFIRSKFAGSKVKVHIDYARQPKAAQAGESSAPTRYFATVTLLAKPNSNLAIEVLKQGLADVVQHRMDDDRAANYDELLQAQMEAKQSKKGLWSSGEALKQRRLMLQNDAQKAKNFLPHLQRERDAKHKCVVEWTSNGSRFGLDIPDQNCLVSFALAGVTCPSTARRNVKDSKDEPFAKEALAFARANCLHQNGVKCRVETIDRAGTFLGTLFVPFKGGEESLAFLLLERGLARVHEFSADQTRYKSSLYDAEKRGKMARAGMWHDWTPEMDRPVAEDEEDEGGAFDSASKLKYVGCSVVDVVDGETVYLRWNTPKAVEDRRKVDEDMDRVSKSQMPSLTSAKKGQLVCASFNDGTGIKFYRARVELVTSSNVRVKFIDYGNEDSVTMDKLRAQSAATAMIPPLAHEKKLAFLKTRALGEEYGNDAAVCLSDLVFNGNPALKGCDTKFGVILAFANDEEAEEEEDEDSVPSTVNKEMIAAGLGFVRNKDGRKIKHEEMKQIYLDMQQAEDIAHRKHLNLWQFGDPRQDEDDE